MGDVSADSSDAHKKDQEELLIDVRSEAFLTSLSVDPGILTPSFDASIFDYQIDLDSRIGETTLFASSNSGILQLDGLSWGGTQRIQLERGDEQELSIRVLSDDGLTSSTYRVTAVRGSIPQRATQIARLESNGDFLGRQLDLDGETVVTLSEGPNSKLFIFARDPVNNEWFRQFESAAPSTESFDWIDATQRVAVFGDNAAVTAVDTSVIVYRRNGTVWTHVQTIEGGQPGDVYFGATLAFSADDTLFVGDYSNNAAPAAGQITANPNNTSLSLSGGVFRYVKSGPMFDFQTLYKADNAGEFDTMARAMDSDGDYLVSCSPQEDGSVGGQNPVDNNDQPNAGACYVYRTNAVTVTFEARLKSPLPTTQQRFGSSVSIRDNVIVVGAPNDSGMGAQSGAVFVFERTGGWEHTSTLNAPFPDVDDEFGYDVATRAGLIYIGAPGDDSALSGFSQHDGSNSRPESGAIYVFRKESESWSEVGVLKPESSMENDSFGAVVEASDAFIAVGGGGVVHIFE